MRRNRAPAFWLIFLSVTCCVLLVALIAAIGTKSRQAKPSLAASAWAALTASPITIEQCDFGYPTSNSRNPSALSKAGWCDECSFEQQQRVTTRFSRSSCAISDRVIAVWLATQSRASLQANQLVAGTGLMTTSFEKNCEFYLLIVGLGAVDCVWRSRQLKIICEAGSAAR